MAKRSSSSGKRRVRTDGESVRSDGVVNRLSGHGTSRDRRMFSQHELDFVNDLDALTIWRSDDLLARAVEAKPFDAWRRGVDVQASDDSKEVSSLMKRELARLEFVAKYKNAGAMANALGGSAILPIFDDTSSRTLDEPAPETPKLRKLVAMHVLQPRELVPYSWYGDIGNARFRYPETYRFVPVSVIGTQAASSLYSTVIHESNLIIWDGIRCVPHHVLGERIGWGDSLYFRVRQIAADYQLTWGSIATLLHDFAQGVYSYEGLHEQLKLKNGKETVRAKVAFMDELRSTIRGMVIDGKDKFERKSTPVSGLADLTVQIAQRVAAAFEMPVTRLMGMSPAGMNATGESDIRIWYDSCEVYRTEIEPKVERGMRLIFAQTDGPFEGKEPETWSPKWAPLWQASAKEIAETRLAVAQADKIYVNDIGAFTASQIARSRAGGDEYSMEYNIDDKDIAAMEKLEAKQMKDALNPPAPQVQMPPASGQAPLAPTPSQPGAGGTDLPNGKNGKPQARVTPEAPTSEN